MAEYLVLRRTDINEMNFNTEPDGLICPFYKDQEIENNSPHRLTEKDIRKRESERFLKNLFPWLD
jgi:hypothetical protein